MNARTFLLAVIAFSVTCLQAMVQNNEKRILVAYFSATGTTAQAAAKLADITDGELYAITPAKPYTSVDLDWHDKQSRSSVEMNDPKSRPALAGKKNGHGRLRRRFYRLSHWVEPSAAGNQFIYRNP